MGAKASTANGEGASPRGPTFSTSSSSEVVAGGTTFRFLRAVPGAVHPGPVHNDRQRARSLSSVPDMNATDQAIGIPNSGVASYDISESVESDSSHEDRALDSPLSGTVGLGRVYAAHSLPSHIWSINGRLVSCSAYDEQGPSFAPEPPGRVEFTNVAGGRVDCSGRGNPLPRAEWVHVGSGLDTEPLRAIAGLRQLLENGSLLFPPFQAEAFEHDIHWTSYRCVLSNSAGIVVSRDVLVRAAVNQHYEPKVQSPGGFLGNNVIIRCTVPPVVQDHVAVTSWLQEPGSFNIYPSTISDGKYHMLPSGELLVLNITRSDASVSYRCRTHHRLTQRSVVSSNAGQIHLTEVPGPVAPILHEKQAVVAARVEDNVVISCVAHANPPPTYRWWRKSSPIDGQDRYVVRGGCLVIPSVRQSDAGQYLCNASNVEGSEVLEVTLTVWAPLSVHVQPARQTVDVGKPASLTCTVSGFPRAHMFWLKDGRTIRSVPSSESSRSMTVSNSVSSVESTGDRLTLPAVAKDDRGMYQCVVKNDHDMAQGTAEIQLGHAAPQLTYRFIEQTLQAGPLVSLKCGATGNPTPHISWTLDGFPLTANDRMLIGQYVTVFGDVISHVNISGVKAEDGGEYECTAHNKAGSSRHSATLNVYGPLSVRPMMDLTVVAGKNLVIKCPVAGYPIDSVHWEKDGVKLPSTMRQRVHGATLSIEKVQSGAGGDQGTYSCFARSKHTSHTPAKGSVNVRVLVPPKITPFAFARDLNVGDRISIQCVVVNGDLPLTFTWLKDRIPVTGASGHGLADVTVRQYDDFNSALSVASISTAHTGNYTCKVANEAATVTYTATLHVNVPPRISPFFFDAVEEGMRTQVMCTTTQGDQPVTITWVKDSKAITSDAANSGIQIKDFSAYSSVLTIINVTANHSGNYTCEVANGAGKVDFTAILSVTVPPKWVVEPTDKDVVLGSSATLQCQAEGSPTPNITWKQAVGSQPGEYRDVAYDFQQLENGALFISETGPQHRGYFLCQANNGIGAPLSKLIRLRVLAGPRIKTRPRSETVRRGQPVVMRCAADGDPPLEIAWKIEGNRIDPSYDVRFDVKSSPSSGGILSELTIVETQLRDRGDYQCLASNAYGEDSTLIQLLVQEPPDFPRNLHVTEQTGHSLLLSWSAPGPTLAPGGSAPAADSPVTAYVLQYKEARDVWHEQNPQMKLAGDKTSFLVERLKPATAYHFRLYAENQLGRSAPSDVLHAVTDSEKPSGPPLHVSVEASTSQELRVTWQPPDREHWNGGILGYVVGYRLAGVGASYNFTRLSMSGEATGDFRLGGLSKYTHYEVIVQAFNARGDGPSSPPVSAQTLEDVPSAPPQEIRCTAQSAHSIRVDWDAPEQSQVNGVVQGYRLIYEPVDDDDTAASAEVEVRASERVSSTKKVLHGLQPATNYSVQVSAYTRIGDGVASKAVLCATSEAAPEAPASIKAVQKSRDTVTLSWLPPRSPNGVLTKYSVHLREVSAGSGGGSGGRDGASGSVRGSVPASLLHFDITGLHENHAYEAWVTAENKEGPGRPSRAVRIAPTSSVPAAIVSWGRQLMVPWKTDVGLDCVVVGIPPPVVEWRIGEDRAPKQVKPETPGEYTLVIPNVQRSNEGNYTCKASNNLGSDHVVYSLQVQVPPTAPLLLATAVTSDSVQLQWKQGDNGGAPIRGFILSCRREQAEWERIGIDRRSATHLLEGLLCGTSYQFTLTALNKIGLSPPSSVQTARTAGGAPVAAASTDFIRVDPAGATLHLAAWDDRNCPILYFVVEYKHEGGEWLLVSNNAAPGKRFPLPLPQADIQFRGTYSVRVTAHNNAGSTSALYNFTLPGPTTRSPDTNGPLSADAAGIGNGNRSAPDVSPFYLDASVIAPIIVSLAAIVIAVGAICFCRHRKQMAADLGPHLDTRSAAMVVLDNKQNMSMEQREQYYATARKPLQSPCRDINTLERIPEYSDDIYPYATFHLPEHENMAGNPRRQAFMYYDTTRQSVGGGDSDHYQQIRPPGGAGSVVSGSAAAIRHPKRNRSRSRAQHVHASHRKSDSDSVSASDSDNEHVQGSLVGRHKHRNSSSSGGGGGSAGGGGGGRSSSSGSSGRARLAAHARPSPQHSMLYHTRESSTSTEQSPTSERATLPIRSHRYRAHRDVGVVEPPTRFSDLTGVPVAADLSDTECELENLQTLRLVSGTRQHHMHIFGPSRPHQDFTIAV